MDLLRTKLGRFANELLPVALSIVLPLLMSVVFENIFLVAQDQYFQCISKEEASNIITTVSVLCLLFIVAIVIFLIIFQVIGAVSPSVLRMAEFLSDRIRFIFEIAVLYVLFLWNLENAIGVHGNCATVDFTKLFTSGPLAFRLVGLFMRWLGLWRPTT